ncbi:MarR family winged helix-turn-helix transcriptional regulator [Streptacidiphilus rugosus]|uniref:MarR family winged helix-turn-helix transcriptional regulator n=1 Tax=Streptacidiphilus rugosus TaxID=405783 RepID=UPI00055B3067|nr:MarR family transcriptional regulator [Streptacidiphilus rugosus]
MAEHTGERGCPDAADLALLEQWNTLQSGFRRLTDQLLADVDSKAGIAPSEFQVLWYLLTSPEQSAPMNQLAATLNFTTAGTTKVADRLTEAGLIRRQTSSADRRVVLATLTAQGQEVAMAAALALAGALRDRVVTPLGPDAFTALADRMRALDPHPQRPCR